MKKTVSLELAPVTVVIDVKENLNNEEVLELAKKQYIKEITKKFPYYKYNMVDGKTISKEEVKIGVPVKFIDTGKVGIIYDVNWANKFPITVALSNGQSMKCSLTAIDKLSKKTSIDKLIKGREDWTKKIGEWHEGNTGYILVEGKNILPVVFGKSRKAIYKAYIVDHEAEGQFYSINNTQSKFVFDTKEEAEAARK